MKALSLLVLSAAVSQAYAVNQVTTGQAGTNGAAGVSVGQAGGNATAGQSLLLSVGPNGDTGNSLVLSGGAGGLGGNGGPGDDFSNLGGKAGNGGAGGLAHGTVAAQAGGANVSAAVKATGGDGGRAGYLYYPQVCGGCGGRAGDGGSATANASAITTGAGNATASATAIGGTGGTADGEFAVAGFAGNVSASAYGSSDTGAVNVSATAIGGGGGGSQLTYYPFLGTDAIADGASAQLVNAVSGNTRGSLSLSQHAVGGKGGTGGKALSQLKLADNMASRLSANVTATGGKAGYLGLAGGIGSAELYLQSTVAGALVEGGVAATGGAGADDTGTAGGFALASMILVGTAGANGSASATGGAGATGSAGGNGGGANTQMTLNGDGLVTGNGSAYGGHGGLASGWEGQGGPNGRGGDASLGMSFSGAGAMGRGVAQGGNAVDDWYSDTSGGSASVGTRASTTGAGLVDLTSLAQGGLGGGGAEARMYVYSGTTAPAGHATAKGVVEAYGTAGLKGGKAISHLEISASGAIQGNSTARAGNAINKLWEDGETVMQDSDNGGAATSAAYGTSTGAYNVTLRSSATAGNSEAAIGGNASALGYGQSRGGVVTVTAQATGGSGLAGHGTAQAQATALTLAGGGGSSSARAVAQGPGVVTSRAEASAVGAGGALAVAVGQGQSGTVTALSTAIGGANRSVSATAAGTVDNNALQASTAAYFGGSGPLLPALGTEVGAISNVRGGDGAIGSGVQAAVTGAGAPTSYSMSGEFKFYLADPQQLQLGFLSAYSLGTGFDQLSLSIVNNGVSLYSHTFTSLTEANLFFTDNTLNFGLLGAGAQSLVISSQLTGHDGGYGFNYMVAVPEPTEWLLMLSGLTLVMVAARRRSKARLRAPDLLHAEAC